MPDCHSWSQDDFGAHHRIHEAARTERLPLGGSLALTHRCSLRCRHCYLGSQEEIRKHKDKELNLAEIKNIIDQAAALGTLNMMLTGGEVMLRPDFSDIYEHVIRKGILVSVLTNGTLVNDEIIELFKNYPPRIVEITCYAATEPTYEFISQVKGSYKRFRVGVDKLKEAGIRFSLKSVVMNGNHHEISDMEQMAADYGVKFRYDTAVFPCMPNWDNGMRSNIALDEEEEQKIENSLLAPLSLRLPINEVLELDSENGERLNFWQEAYEHSLKREIPKSRLLYKCGAGRTSFHLDPYGRIQPCLLTTSPSDDLRKVSFELGWSGKMSSLLLIEVGANFECHSCEGLDICPGCPSLFILETGSPEKISKYICEMTKKRLEKIQEQASLIAES